MDKDGLRNEVITNIRACLISVKGKCDLEQVRNDYCNIMGTDIPYKTFGFKTLKEFLLSVPSLSVTTSANKIMVEAKTDEKTSHIAKLVSRQKNTSKTRNSAQNYNKRLNIVSNWKPKLFNCSWHQQNVNNPPPHRSVLPHNQFINNSNSTIKKKFRSSLPPRLVKLKTGKHSTTATVDTTTISETQKDKNLTEKNQRLFTNGELKKDIPSSEDNKSRETDHVLKKEIINDFHTGNYIDDLQNYLAKLNLDDPVYKISSRKTKQDKTYYCCVKVGDKSYSSYPADFTKETDARQYVAKLALGDIKGNRPRSLLLSNEQDILDRLPPFLKKHFHGLWNWQLEEDYKDLYKEQLPINWMEIIDVLPCISIEPSIDNKFVLRYCNPGEIFQKRKNGILEHSVYTFSVPSSSVDFVKGQLLAEVTCAVSTTEVWCRQLDTEGAELFYEMIIKMNDFYSNSLKKTKLEGSISKGGYYVVMLEKDTWARVLILDIEDKENVKCFFIDSGDASSVSISNLFILEREFAKVQAQAFLCVLKGLEPLEEASQYSESLQNLVGKTVQIELVSTAEESVVDGPCTAIMIIMSDIVTGAVINNELISSITMESATPVLKKQHSAELYVSHIEETGEIFVVFHSKGYEQLQKLLKTFEEELSAGKIPSSLRFVPNRDNSQNLLLLVQHRRLKTWQRCKVKEWDTFGCNFVQMYFVDIGDTDVIPVERDIVYRVKDINDILNRYPEQAIELGMAFEKWTDVDIQNKLKDFVPNIRKLMPVGEPVLVKLVDDDLNGCNGRIPKAEFFKRSDKNKMLFPVNKCLQISFENEIGEQKMKNNKLEQLMHISLKNVPSSGLLKSPNLPLIGNYFDVKVPCAVNPWNFFIQPYASHKELNKLMNDLQNTYDNNQFSPLSMDEVSPGKIFASKSDDGIWYRTSVIKVIHSGSISVFYCDFGYYGNLTLDKLMPLRPEYLKLPYQAVKAKLAGIKPKNDKWTTEDCIYFESLVCRKGFVSVLTSIERDELYRSDFVIVLKLIDTSGKGDIYVDEVLIEKGIAVNVD